MSLRYPGSFLSTSLISVSNTSAGGIWTHDKVAQYAKSNQWPLVPNVTIVGVSISDGTETLSYPAGTLPGDLAIAVPHNFLSTKLPFTPTGYTTKFTTSADPYGYAKTVSTRIIQSGDASVIINTDSGVASANFDGTLIVIRGRTAVSNSYAWNNTGAGGSLSLNVPVSGTLIAIATDRGASGYPTISGATFNQTTTRGLFYFWQRTSVLKEYTASTSITFTDYNDSYNTNMLMIVAT